MFADTEVLKNQPKLNQVFKDNINLKIHKMCKVFLLNTKLSYVFHKSILI